MDFWRRYILKPRAQSSDLLDDIRSTVLALNAVREWFNAESDADMIESCVYELEALEARYRHLLRLAKERGLSCCAFTHETNEDRSA